MSKVRALLGCALVLVVVSCAPAPGATRIEITTIETVCGGVEPPEGPACRTGPVARSVEVRSGDAVVAAGTTGLDGTLVVAVPPGELVVSVPDAEPFMNCDAPTVTAVVGSTTPVTQTCAIFYPSPPS